jgi:Spy/CpxP family protein refolding chaperone
MTSRVSSPPSLTMLLILAMAATAACDKSSSSGGQEAPTPTASSPPAASSPPPTASASASASAAAPAEDAAAAQAEDDQKVADELLTHHRHKHQGFAGFVLMAVETIGVAPEQQSAIDGIRKDYRLKMKPLHEANNTVLLALADGLASGTIDKAKVDAAVAKAGAASSAVQAATPDLLVRLHDALRPEQRPALVDKVDAHWAAWRDANGGGAGDAGAETKGDRRFRRLAKDLGLSSDQVDKLRAALDTGKDSEKPFDPAAAETYLKAFDTAFVADKLDAKALPAAGPESGRIVSFGAGRMARLYEALAPLLTPDQKTKAADMLRQRAEPKDKP